MILPPLVFPGLTQVLSVSETHKKEKNDQFYWQLEFQRSFYIIY